MVKITRSIDVGISPTPEELAKVFCDMCSGEQADFLNYVAAISDKWPRPFCFQLQAITDEERLTKEARVIMRQFGEYSDKDAY